MKKPKKLDKVSNAARKEALERTYLLRSIGDSYCVRIKRGRVILAKNGPRKK